MKVAKKFILRGLIAAGFGPLILAIVYYCLHQAGIITNLSVNEVAWGIFSTFLLAFVQGGAGAVFTIEKLSMKKLQLLILSLFISPY